MQLLRLEVQNWVHHRKRVCEFTRGLVAILGENGSGKSSLFAAINWLLTGENPNYGTKAENISQYAKDDEPSYAKLEFEHNGHVAIVTRYLRPEKEQSTLVVDCKEVARGDKATTAGIENLLGIDAKFISRFIIVGQMDIFSFIDQRQGEVDTFFQQLFGTTKAQKCNAAIGEILPLAKPPEILKTAGEIEHTQQAVQEQIDAAEEKLSGIPTIEAFLKTQQADQAIINQWESKEKLAAELAQLAQRAEEYDNALKTDDDQIKQYESDLEALADAFGGQDEAYTAAKVALTHWSNYKAIAERTQAIEAERKQIAEQRANNPAPEVVAQSVIDMASQSCHRLCQELSKAEEFVKVFSEAGTAECPTCHTPTRNLQLHIDAANTSIPILRQQVVEASKELNDLKTRQRAYTQWEKLDHGLAVRDQELQKSAAQLISVSPPSGDESVLQQTVGDYEAMQVARKDITEMLHSLKEHRAQLAGVAKTIAERQADLTAAAGEITTTKDDAHLARQRLEKVKEQCAVRQQLEKEADQLKFTYKQLEEQRLHSLEQEKEAARLKEWLQIATQAREAFKNAPRIVAMRNLQRLETAINELLQIFSVNFLIRVGGEDTPTFVAEFYDGRKQVAQRLSVGQKTVLALAFRVACNAMFAEEIGLLALDEPTAALDAVRVQALAPVLEKLRELSTAKGLQCLLVTHATSLSHLFESTIELEAPETRNVKEHGRNGD